MIDFLAAAPEQGAVPLPSILVHRAPFPSHSPTQDNTNVQSGAAAGCPPLLPRPGISHCPRRVKRGRKWGRAYKAVSLGLQALSIYMLWSKLLSLRNIQGNGFDS